MCLLSKYSPSSASRVENECMLLKLKLIAMNIEFENGAHSAIIIAQNYFKSFVVFFSFLISFQCFSLSMEGWVGCVRLFFFYPQAKWMDRTHCRDSLFAWALCHSLIIYLFNLFFFSFSLSSLTTCSCLVWLIHKFTNSSFGGAWLLFSSLLSFSVLLWYCVIPIVRPEIYHESRILHFLPKTLFAVEMGASVRAMMLGDFAF